MRKDGADVIIVAGAPLVDLTHTFKDRIPVPIVDSIFSTIRHCEGLIAPALNGAMEGSFAYPPYKSNYGLPPALAIMLV